MISTTSMTSMRLQDRKAMTLVELLVVMAIIVALVAMVVPSIASLQAMNISRTADQMIAKIVLAKQMAMLENKNIEVRFYRFPDASQSPQPLRFQAMQLFKMEEESGAKAMDAIWRFPGIVVIDADHLSPLIATQPLQNASAQDPELPELGRNYEYVSLIFRPDGALAGNLGAPRYSYFTLRAAREDLAMTSLPDNFAIVQLTNAQGHVRLFRP